MRLIATLIFTVCTYATLHAQSADEVLQSIAANNPALHTLRATADASRLDNATGLNLSDPQVDFAYKWGAPSDALNKVDLSVTQEFDYATVFGLKRQEARMRNTIVDIEQQQQEQIIMLEASELLINLVHSNRLSLQYAERLAQMRTLVDKYQKALSAGEVSRLDISKVRLALAELQAEADAHGVQHQSLLSQLRAYNGGIDIAFSDTVYPSAPLSYTAYSAQPTASHLLQVRGEAQQNLSAQEVRMARAASLPSLSVGYVSELTKAEKLRGVGIGLSIPLWSNHNNVRRAKAHQQAQAAAIDEARLQLQSQREQMQTQAAALQSSLTSSRRLLAEVDDTAMMALALSAGEISLIDYIWNMQNLYSLRQQVLLTERDYRIALLRLSAL